MCAPVLGARRQQKPWKKLGGSIGIGEKMDNLSSGVKKIIYFYLFLAFLGFVVHVFTGEYEWLTRI